MKATISELEAAATKHVVETLRYHLSRAELEGSGGFEVLEPESELLVRGAPR